MTPEFESSAQLIYSTLTVSIDTCTHMSPQKSEAQAEAEIPHHGELRTQPEPDLQHIYLPPNQQRTETIIHLQEHGCLFLLLFLLL